MVSGSLSAISSFYVDSIYKSLYFCQQFLVLVRIQFKIVIGSLSAISMSSVDLLYESIETVSVRQVLESWSGICSIAVFQPQERHHSRCPAKRGIWKQKVCIGDLSLDHPPDHLHTCVFRAWTLDTHAYWKGSNLVVAHYFCEQDRGSFVSLNRPTCTLSGRRTLFTIDAVTGQLQTAPDVTSGAVSCVAARAINPVPLGATVELWAKPLSRNHTAVLLVRSRACICE